MDGSGTTDRVDRAALSPGVSTAGATHTREADPLTVTKRLQRDGRWPDIEPLRDQMMRECRQKGMSKAEAQAWTYSELDRLYPPPMEKPGEQNATSPDGNGTSVTANFAVNQDVGRVQGLDDIPADWPTLPANASLAAEIQWVQASRLDVVEEDASTPGPRRFPCPFEGCSGVA
jgi:hypothetical protein